jgi:hypothetical protein
MISAALLLFRGRYSTEQMNQLSNKSAYLEENKPRMMINIVALGKQIVGRSSKVRPEAVESLVQPVKVAI